MSISVLMCTYNGEKYIEEQLISIYEQTYKPDEVLIFDDCSTDSTVHIVQSFIKKYNLEKSWILEINENNKGYVKNFKNGINKVKGDFIFFSDQDDVWNKNKIQSMMNYFTKYDDACVLGTDLIHFYPDSSERIEGSLDNSIEKVQYKKKSDFIPHPAGCTMAIKRKYALNKMNLYSPEWSHDEFFWRMATVDRCCYRIHKCFLRHRMSGTNVTSLPFKSKKERVSQASRNKNNYKQLLCYSEEIGFPVDQIEIIKYFAKGNSLRFLFLNKPSVINFLKLLQYKCIFLTNKQLLGDIYYTLFKGK